MKYITLAGIAMLAMAACSKPQTKQQKAEKLVTDYIKERMDDPSSYESAGFDTMFVSLKNFPGEHDLDESVELCYTYMDSTQMFNTHRDEDYATKFADIKPDAARSDFYQRKADSVNKYIDSHGIKRDEPPARYILPHKFRAKNAFGATVLNVVFAEVDTNTTKVRRIRDAQTMKPWGGE